MSRYRTQLFDQSFLVRPLVQHIFIVHRHPLCVAFSAAPSARICVMPMSYVVQFLKALAAIFCDNFVKDTQITAREQFPIGCTLGIVKGKDVIMFGYLNWKPRDARST